MQYTIRRGDTLWNIARNSGTTVQAITKLNNIADPDRILAGQVIRLPGEDNSYQVKSGDTLWRLAQDNNTTVMNLAKINKIADPDRLYVGQQLRLR